ncbi:MAG: repressor LexA [Planctomycetes bacterium]|nr:repressor LexA [Planctomycetota bacterium]
METLTEKQQEVLTFIEDCLRENDPPTQREIGDYFGMAQNSVYQLIGYLKKKGYLADIRGHRCIKLSDAYLRHLKATQGIPIVGRVAAGQPILAEENIEGYLDVQAVFGRAEGTFFLRVVGDSMIDEGIMEGDLVLVKPATEIENGRISVVLLDDEATVKRVYRQKYRIALKPANKRAGYKTLYAKPRENNIRMVGHVIGCLRTVVQ